MGENTGRYDRLRAVFDAAVRKDPAARPGYLDHACAGDPALRHELERLLEAHQKASSFLERAIEDLPLPVSADDDFPGTERFTVLRRLGAGGMGVVYEVHDRARGEIVALKTLRHPSPAGVYRLKQEFRSLTGVAHANVVCLYELVVDAARCFFTMELVKGVNLVEYVRPGPRGALSLDRLTSTLGQLVDGVSALHRMGKLHRDIKPSNVLVNAEGRVVILDFGLITELFPDDLGGAEYFAGGTPAYVSPEEASGMPPSEAGDWYGVGATLYEALTGRVPFSGAPLDVLLRKTEVDPPSPADVTPEAPGDLSSICMGLMCRDPTRRLSGPEAISTLGHDLECSRASRAITEPFADALFVGRQRELDVLDSAFHKVVRGGAAAVYVYGPSGIGKSALVRAFIGRLTVRHDAVVLAGRCHEHESVPFKVLDGVVDSLSRFLISLPESAAESVLPPDAATLPRLFPVMLRIPAMAEKCGRQQPPISDPYLLRQRAVEVLRQLLVRIAARWGVVIVIDDLQWADLDGALLLEELLRPPDAPALLTVVSFRSEEAVADSFFRKLLQGRSYAMWKPLALGPMPDSEASDLVDALLSAHSPLSDGARLQITREAGGSPFVLEQLARYAAASTVTELPRGPTLAAMFEARLDGLSPDARRFLETLAICGRPMLPELICAACGIARDRQPLLAMLRSVHLIRSSGSPERVETFHDRIREVLAARIAPDAVRRIHQRLVHALVDYGSDDCEALFEHYQGAGDTENASIQAGRAGAAAAAALAFDRAALLYQKALALTPASPTAQVWREGLANALANAGRPAEAAEAYLCAAAGAGHLQRVELQRRAAEQFLIGGHIDRGLDLIRIQLADLGMSMPRSPRTTLLSLLWRRARLRWRGLGYVSRPVADIDADALLRVDTCCSATAGLFLVDMIRASDFSVRHLLIALDAGEPYRVARAMALASAGWSAYPTGGTLSRRLVEQSKELATTVGSPHAMALSILADGIITMTAGEWKKALTFAEQALAILREHGAGLTWELNIAQNLVIWALMYLGELGEVSRRVPVLLADARSRGNLYLATELCTRSNYVWLAADDPDAGERETVESIAQWSQKGFHRQHYSALLARVQTGLYRGNAEASWGLLAAQEPMLRRSLMTRIPVIRVESLYLRARCALALAARGRGSRRFLSVARAGARRIERERMRWSDPIALLLRAGIAYVDGSTPLALRYLHDAADRFDRADMRLYAAVAGRRIGALRDDAPARELQRRAEEWMATQQIKNPVCMTRMLAPGFPD